MNDLFSLDTLLGITAADYEDDYDIENGLPKWCELMVPPTFFGRLSRGLHTNRGTLYIKAFNQENKYWPDLGIVVENMLPGEAAGFIEVERKTPATTYLFDKDLPLNIPIYSFRSHTGEQVPMVRSGKWRLFEQHPDASFFMAVQHDAKRAIITNGHDIIASPREWVHANGPFHGRQDPHNGEIYVARVPRIACVVVESLTTTAEEYVLRHLLAANTF